MRGQKVRTLVARHFKFGNHTDLWNTKNDCSKRVSSGIHFYRMRIGNYTSTKKMILMK